MGSPLPLIRPSNSNYTETIDFKVVPCRPGLNQHDQLDRDEWFSTDAIFSPGLCLGISPKLAPFPPCCSSSLCSPTWSADFSTLIWINWSDNYAGNLVEPTKEIRPKLRSAPDKKGHN